MKIINRIDNKLRNLFDNKKVLLIIGLISVTIIAIIIRLSLFGITTWDYEDCLSRWFNQLKDGGGLPALGQEIGNYNIPYLTIMALLTYLPFNSLYSIKMISCIFDIIGAIFAALIVVKLTKNKENKNFYGFLTYTFTLMLPTVFLNSAAWAQCDFIYVTFILISIYKLLEKKHSWAFIFLGIAISFKLQAIFVLPFYILLYFRNKNFSIFNFLLIPVIVIISFMPAVIMGRSIQSCFMVYFMQPGTFTDLSLKFPNLYSLITEQTKEMEFLVYATTGFAIFILGMFIFYIMYKKYKISNKSIINLALLINFICVYFLPRMHERYNFLSEILILIVLFTNKFSIKNLAYVIIMQLGTLSGYLSYLLGTPWSYINISAIFVLIVLISFGVDTIKQLKLENEENNKVNEKEYINTEELYGETK